MRWFNSHTPSIGSLLTSLIVLSPLASAIRLIESKSLVSCQDDSNFTASLFDVVFTPDNRTLTFDIVGVSSISGNVTAEIEVIAYGYTALKETLDPCASTDLSGMCPMNTGEIDISSNIVLDADVVAAIPGIAYTVPDLDGLVQIYINSTDEGGKSIACMQAELSNGKTVYQKGVGWATAVIAGMGLVAAAVTSGLGHSNTAAHVAANAVSLFGFFQAQAYIGMTAVEMPPIVRAWTQNFQWSMGIVRVTFLQDICTWYLRSTGGTASDLLSSLSTESVEIAKRSAVAMHKLLLRAHHMILAARSNASSTTTSTSETVTVHGIMRVGFVAGIEATNIFMTGLIFFIVFMFFVAIAVAAFKAICELSAKQKWTRGEKFQDFRNGWKVVIKGIMFRMTLIGFPQMSVLCLWELTRSDSAGEMALAVVIYVSMLAALGFAALKVILLAKRSVSMHKNPAYMLYSDPACLNKWGFLYVQYRATAYYYVLPALAYILLKSVFIAFGQKASTVQAIGLVVIEAGWLVAASVVRPWMDKKTNVFNIAISAVNFLSAIFLLVFTGIFDQPGLVTGVMGVIFFIYNAVFALVLLILVLLASGYAIFSKNPDNRYQPMRDDRGSFIKSQDKLTTELDALGATARGDVKHNSYNNGHLSNDKESWSSDSHSNVGYSGVAAGSQQNVAHPVESNMPLFPSDSAEHGDAGHSGYHNQMYNDQHYNNSTSDYYPQGHNQPYGHDTSYDRAGSMNSQAQYQQQPYQQDYSNQYGGGQQGGYRQQGQTWQRGTGYEH